ncbi:ABC transporter, ATP-binding protein (cluster 2, ribose/xylose/arabinose/galactose) / ABC transporter, ATP-binding protein (cluster 2, ribose/xylose/arabinose/galactose) [Olavius sp. associated proteobacterium Delta 1]|nr:ABC transporter, ATP-binding protein (cluster 2, ribose/xylose/arabinose/galactose) / ABC transporter, ATP-binding protein (cluster 2, ribose/xylose/arabinose/galactose) [Olavius sp. associated proteobacterium Delta 1]
MESSPFLLRAEAVDKRFPGVHALDKVDFDLQPGEVHVLLGENGAGKSTLMKIISGTLSKDSGRIFFRDQEIDLINPYEARNLGIGMVYQELSLLPSLSVAENIFLGNFPKRSLGTLHWSRLFKATHQLLDEFGVRIDPRQRVGTLGMAERQLVEIAKALSMKVRILLLDEPTSALSDEERRRLFDTIQRLQEKGVGIVYVSHRLDEVPQIGQRVTVLRDGRKIDTLPVAAADQNRLIHLMVGRELKGHFPKEAVDLGREILRVEGLTVRKKLFNLDLTLREGEILGLAGLMGAGRTELARALFGIDKIDSGTIFVNGRQVNISSAWQAIEAGLGYLTENRNDGLIARLSVTANIILASLKRLCTMGFLRWPKEKNLSERYIRELNIHAAGFKQKVELLSGGNQQKVALAKWMCSHAKIMIFDEPTRGIDVGAKIEVFRLMNQLVKKGVGIIMISSELPEIMAMADRILVMCRGSLSAEFQRGEATQEDILKYAVIGGE